MSELQSDKLSVTMSTHPEPGIDERFLEAVHGCLDRCTDGCHRLVWLRPAVPQLSLHLVHVHHPFLGLLLAFSKHGGTLAAGRIQVLHQVEANLGRNSVVFHNADAR